MKIVSKLVRNMTDEEIKACRYLRMREGSRIAGDLIYHVKHFRSGARVVLVKDDEQIVSWGLIDYSEGVHPVVQLYTRRSHRRRGLGTRVIRRIKRILGCDEFICFSHDDVSTKFFSTQAICDPRSNDEADGDD